MNQREMALMPLMGGAAEAAGASPRPTALIMVPAGADGGRFVNRPYGEEASGAEQDEVQMRLWEEMAKNRVLDMELECAHKRIRAEAKRKEAKRQLRKEALKLLGWLGVGFGCGLMALACWFLAPRWTCIAPAVLMALAWWKAGGEV